MNNPFTSSSWKDWTGWARKAVVSPVVKEVRAVGRPVTQALFGAVGEGLNRVRFPQLAALINNPHALLRDRLQQRFAVENLRVFNGVAAVRDAQVPALTAMLDDYLVRLDAVELAVSALLGRRLPVIEAFSADLHRLLGKADPKRDPKDFPASLLCLFDEVTGTFHALLSQLQITQAAASQPSTLLNLQPGHFYGWVCCTTEVDKQITSAEQKKQQQMLRQTMMKVMLSYIDNINLDPARLVRDGASALGQTSLGGFPLARLQADAALHNGSAFMRAYAGLFAAAFEHVFVSSRPLIATGPAAGADLFHALPMTLKLQRADLARLAFVRRDASPWGDRQLDMELNCEFMAMRIATTLADVSAGMARTAINGLANGIWEISPNNPPLVDTLASLITIPIHALEKALVYDLLRRFRVYVTDKPLQPKGEFVIATMTMKVPDSSAASSTEKAFTAVVAVACDDRHLLDAARQLLGTLPVRLEDPGKLDGKPEAAKLLHGMLKDTLAAACVLSM